jgi:creatinine amidohydrolase
MTGTRGSPGDEAPSPSARGTRYGSLTYEEIRQRAAEGALAIVPTGCTEQQGPHLPVDFDTWFAERLMLAAADRARSECAVDALVLPALPFGPTPEHRSYGAGYIDIPEAVHHAMIWAILSSLADQGFGRIVVWRGCGGHHLNELMPRFNALGRARVFLPQQPYHAIWCRIGDGTVPGGHADSFTTSICLYLRPHDVRTHRIINPGKQAVDWNDANPDFTRYSATGVIGDPTHASAELGEELWQATVQVAASELQALACRS